MAGAARRPGAPAPGRGRGGAGPPARPGARLPDRQPGDAAAYRDPRRRRLRGLAHQPGPGRRGELERWPAAISVGTNPTFDGHRAQRRGATRWTATTWTCTGRTWRWTSSPGSAAWNGSTRSTSWWRRCTATSDAARACSALAGRAGPVRAGPAVSVSRECATPAWYPKESAGIIRPG